MAIILSLKGEKNFYLEINFGTENIGSVSKVIIRTRLHNFVQKKLGLSEAFASVLPLRRRIETFNDFLSLVMQEGGLVNKTSWVRFLFLIILFTRTCRSIFNASLESEKELNGRKP